MKIPQTVFKLQSEHKYMMEIIIYKVQRPTRRYNVYPQHVFKEKIRKIIFRIHVCLCYGLMAQSTQWGHVERSQFT